MPPQSFGAALLMFAMSGAIYESDMAYARCTRIANTARS